MNRTFKMIYSDKNDKAIITLSCSVLSGNGFKSVNETDKAQALVSIERFERCLSELKNEFKPLI
ncbi:MAG: hypothetical protein V4560_14895 [Bacteroidota bacterium]